MHEIIIVVVEEEEEVVPDARLMCSVKEKKSGHKLDLVEVVFKIRVGQKVRHTYIHTDRQTEKN